MCPFFLRHGKGPIANQLISTPPNCKPKNQNHQRQLPLPLKGALDVGVTHVSLCTLCRLRRDAGWTERRAEVQVIHVVKINPLRIEKNKHQNQNNEFPWVRFLDFFIGFQTCFGRRYFKTTGHHVLGWCLSNSVTILNDSFNNFQKIQPRRFPHQSHVSCRVAVSGQKWDHDRCHEL